MTVADRTAELLGGELGVAYQHSPAWTAENLLRGLLAKRGELRTLALPSVAEHWRATNEPTLAWVRALLPDELARPWVLAVDRTGAYLHSLELCDVGLGEPEYRDSTNEDEKSEQSLNVWQPGFYHARIGPWREVCLPDPLRLGRAGDWHWLTAPTFRLGASLGLVLEVDQAWIWPRKSRVFASIARRLVRARERAQLEQEAGVDREVKDAYKRLVGRLRARFHRGTPLYRPDWYAHIVADARCRIWRGAHEALQDGVAPAACNLDCWYYVLDRPELPPAFDRKWWHLDATAPAARVGLDVFADGALVGAVAKRVKAAAQ
jgi:hypothetical protein